MSIRAIHTSIDQSVCDVCGRTLLRGERAEVYVSGGGERHSVCELCTSRALHDGWVREGDVPEYDGSGARADRRRSLFGRLRGRRDRREPMPEPEPDYGDLYADEEFEPAPEPEPDPGPEPGRRSQPRSRPQRAPRARPTSPSWPEPVKGAASRLGGATGREPRHVRAVPTSIGHRSSSAVALFNDSEHPRTVAGIARSLGLPDVAVHPSDVNGSQVNIVVSWELCWYRYEVELADEVPAVRSAAQGYELSELSEIELQNNARADDRGHLKLTG